VREAEQVSMDIENESNVATVQVETDTKAEQEITDE
jgi:hypothetical protein